ncbi:MAG: FtsX-like permease family protein [Candidatus Bathyarchaeota archaeon]|nr:FtsX-like permease family protein [Candidatus Termiticorpusculum sp.]
MGIFSRAARNIIRKKKRTALILVVLSISVALMLTLPASIDANQQASQKRIDAITSHLGWSYTQLNAIATEIDFSLVHTPSFGSYKDLEEGYQYYPLMDLTEMDKFSLIPNVEKVIPILIEAQWTPKAEYNKEFEHYYAIFHYDVYGIPLEADLLEKYPTILPSNISAGRNLRAGDRGVVVLDEIVSGNLSASVGDTVNILGQDFTVVGIKGEGSLGLRTRATGVFMSLEEAQKITNNTGKASLFQIFADSADNVVSIEANIKNLYPLNLLDPINIRVNTATYVLNDAQQIIDNNAAFVAGIERTMGQIRSSAVMGMVLAVIAQVAVVLFIISYSVRERTKEIGTLRAMGSSSKNILGQFVFEGALLSLVAGVIGVFISVVGASQLGHFLLPNFNVPDLDMTLTAGGKLVSMPIAVDISFEWLLLGLGVAVLLGVVGSLYPAWRASRIRPAEAMRYE